MGYGGQVENLLIVQGDYRYRENSEAAYKEPPKDMFEGTMYGGVCLDWKGVRENNNVVKMVENDAAASQVLDHEPRNSCAMPVMRNTTSGGKTRMKKACPVVNSLIPLGCCHWSRKSIDHDPHIIAFDVYWIAADMSIGVGETLARGDVESPEVPGATHELALDGTLAYWSSTMRAFVVDGVNGILYLKESDELATSLYYLAIIAGNFPQGCHFDLFVCHTGLLNKDARGYQPIAPQLRSRSCPHR
jgi:hypothetical protein